VRGLFLLLAVLLLPLAARADDAAKFQPHWVSQRVTRAALRQGPGYQYRILWIYRHKGYPFKESASFDIWRRVTAADGTVGWMSGQMLSDNRTVLVTGNGRAEIRKSAARDSKLAGSADAGAILNVKACRAETCRVEAQGVEGWIDRSRLWGVDPGETFK
jgi:SH3-like domain-containing protein